MLELGFQGGGRVTEQREVRGVEKVRGKEHSYRDDLVLLIMLVISKLPLVSFY